MSANGKLPSVDFDKDHNENISAFWHNHVLTVLLDIRHKNLKEYAVSFANGCGTTLQNEYTEDLRSKVEGWIGRLSVYLSNAYAEGMLTLSVHIAEFIKEQLEKSLPIANSSPRKRNFIQRMLDENNRPYFSMLGAVAAIQSKFDFYMEQIENSGDMDAAQALLFTFVRNYCRIVERFNQKFEELPTFYLHEILKATPKDAIQDSAYVVLSPNKEMVNKTFSLPMGTRFAAGVSMDENVQYYSLTEKAYVMPTVLKSAHTLFQQGTKIITFLRRFQTVIYFPIPTEELRFALWQSMLPKEWLGEDAEGIIATAAQIELSGGAIVNIVRQAALLIAGGILQHISSKTLSSLIAKR